MAATLPPALSLPLSRAQEPKPTPMHSKKEAIYQKPIITRAKSVGMIHPKPPRRLQKIKSEGSKLGGTVKGIGWIAAPVPRNNDERIAKLKSYNVLDTPPEIAYDDIAKIAAAVCGTEMAAISLLDDSRQWFKATAGFSAAETPIDQAFCAHTIIDMKGFMEVKDAARDDRFYGNPLVTGGPSIRFYAGAALVTPDNQAVGALCVLDKKPHAMNKHQNETLKALSRLVVNQLEARAQNIQLIELHNKLQESQKKLAEANEALLAQNQALKERIAEIGMKHDELELNAPVSKVIDLLSNIQKTIYDRNQKALLKDAINIIASHKLYEVDVEEAISQGTNVDAQTKGFLLTQLDSPTVPKENIFASSDGLVNVSLRGSKLSVSRSANDVSMTGDDVVGEKRPHSALSRKYTFSVAPKGNINASEEAARIGAIMEGAKDLVTGMGAWEYDVFNLAKNCKKPLFYSTLHLLHKAEILKKMPLSAAKLVNFLTEMEAGYVHENPYHNHIHAADVTLGSNYIVSTSGILTYMTPAEQLALILASAVHDLGHLGVNNAFLVQTAHELAVSHNDKSVLENYHCVQAFKLLYSARNDFLENIPLTERQDFRKMVIELVLATDMAHHVDIFNAFQNKRTAAGGLDIKNNKQDRLLLMKMAIKCADISNSAKPRPLYLQWANRVMEEFWAQGDEERKLGIPVSSFMDRTQPDVPKCQIGFIQFIALPFYSAMVEQFPALASCADYMKENLEYWKSQA